MKRARQGGVLAGALAVLLVAILVTGTVVRTLILQHREAIWQHHRSQAFWLAESAAEWVRAELARDPDLEHAVWRRELRLDGRLQVATAEIVILRSDSVTRHVTIRAWWPDDPFHRVTTQKEFQWHEVAEEPSS